MAKRSGKGKTNKPQRGKSFQRGITRREFITAGGIGLALLGTYGAYRTAEAIFVSPEGPGSEGGEFITMNESIAILDEAISKGDKYESIFSVPAEELEEIYTHSANMVAEHFGIGDEILEVVDHTEVVNIEEMHDITAMADLQPVSYDSLPYLGGKTYEDANGVTQVALHGDSYFFNRAVLQDPVNRQRNPHISKNVIEEAVRVTQHEYLHYAAGMTKLDVPRSFTSITGDVFTYDLIFGFATHGENSTEGVRAQNFGNIDEIAVELMHRDMIQDMNEINLPIGTTQDEILYSGMMEVFFKKLGINDIQELSKVHRSKNGGFIELVDLFKQAIGGTDDDAFAAFAEVSNTLALDISAEEKITYISERMNFSNQGSLNRKLENPAANKAMQRYA